MPSLSEPVSLPEARPLTGTSSDAYAFSIATLVTDLDQYRQMRLSFAAGGFTDSDCEYLFIDNTGLPSVGNQNHNTSLPSVGNQNHNTGLPSVGHQTCAFAGLNRALREARGRYVILCHQDVRLIDGGDDRADLEARLAELQCADDAWAIAGNAGGCAPGQLALRITDPHGRDRHVGDLPARAVSLDENFLVVRRSANLGLSRDVSGFHFYATDLCLVADVLGWRAYVIDFHLNHLSAGDNQSSDFAERKEGFRAKWATALRPRWIQTTCALLRIDGAPLGQFFGHLFEIPYQKLSRRLRGARGWSGPGSATATVSAHKQAALAQGPLSRDKGQSLTP